MKSLPTSRSASLEALESRIAPAVVYALGADGELFTVDSSNPEQGEGVGNITGTSATETFVGIDFRPATGELYLLTRETGLVGTGTGRLYVVDTETAEATLVSTLAADPADATSPYAGLQAGNYGIDFNPNVDRLRIVSDAGVNLRVNVATGLVTTDGTINPDGSSISGVAYTESTARGGVTTLYGIDTVGDRLVIQNPPNNGTVTAVGDLMADVTSVVGFDIYGTDNRAVAAMVKEGEVRFYSINLRNGFALDLGTLGNGQFELAGMAVEPELTASRSYTFRDVDGDIVTITTSKDVFTSASFSTRPAGTVGGVQIESIDIFEEMAKANITITAVRGPLGGDGLVNIGQIDATGVDLGKVSVAGDLGAIFAGDNVATGVSLMSLRVQSMGVLGTSTQGAEPEVGSNIAGNVGSITILGDLAGGAGLFVNGNLTTFVVGGNMEGGAEEFSGTLFVTGNLGKATVSGSLFGSAAEYSGTITANGTIGSVTVKGSLFGNFGPASGAIIGSSSIKTVVIGRDVIGGPGNFSGSIASLSSEIDDLGAISSVTVNGSVIGGPNGLNGIISDGTLGKVKIAGDMRGSAAGGTAKIIAEGNLTPANAKAALALANLTIGGKVQNAEVLIGYSRNGTLTNSDVQVGSVVARDWVASNLAVGVAANGNGFGNDNDSLFNNGESTSIPSRIASVIIRGQIAGTVGGTDAFAITAEQIAKFQVGKVKLPMTSGQDNFLLGATGDFRVREVAPLLI